MLWFTVLAVWCASGCALGDESARDKPFYPETTHAQHFEEFKATYSKQYATPEEERRRFEIFKNNLNEINELNVKYKETVYAITQFSDLTTEEFVARHTGLVVDKNRKPSPPPLLNLSSIEVPDSFDWREKNVVTKVKNQGGCGSCWAFGIIGSLESQYAIKYNKLVDFSEKQLVDCDTFDAGCGGGTYGSSVGYILANGVETNADYPYMPLQTECSYDAKKVAVKIKGFESFIGVEEDVLKKILYLKGPIAIAIDADPVMRYYSGIIQDCDHRNINHAVLLVGYGTEKGVDYWLIKNSWNELWGENGYFRIQRDKTCLGISKAPGTEVMRPIVA